MKEIYINYMLSKQWRVRAAGRGEKEAAFKKYKLFQNKFI